MQLCDMKKHQLSSNVKDVLHEDNFIEDGPLLVVKNMRKRLMSRFHES